MYIFSRYRKRRKGTSNPKMEGKHTIYTVPRTFKHGAKLHEYLSMETPELINQTTDEYTLFTVLTALRSIVSRDRLYDPNNTNIIILENSPLEEVLGVKSLHVTEVRDWVAEQMDIKDPSTIKKTEDKEEEKTQDQKPNESTSIYNNTNMRFALKPLFREAIQQTKGFDNKKTAYTYKELTTYLSQYILERKDEFFDDRNIKIAHVQNDKLGQAFNVKAFHRTQVTKLLRQQLIPIGLPMDRQKETTQDAQNNHKRSETTAPSTQHNPHQIEYEIDSDTSSEQNSEESDASSIEDITIKQTAAEILQQQGKQTSQEDRDSGSDEEKMTEQQATTKRLCLNCKQPCQFRYCTTCYKEHKNKLPERPKPKTRKRGKQTNKNQHTENVKRNYTHHAQKKGKQGENLCNFCLSNPKNSTLIHGKTSHQICCYACSKKLFKKRKPCPICRRKIEKITINIMA